ncbi:MAG: choice-of-anchor tandem repeat GloVer-containing protein, partial [Bacteroidota bacterium]
MKNIKTIIIGLLLILNINITKAQNTTELWGMTAQGGYGGGGVIYKTDSTGANQIVVKSFTEIPGSQPQNTQLCQTANNKLYGMTQAGGIGKGVIFELDPTTNIYTIKHNFTDTSGSSPQGSLTLASNGKLYGLTELGGATDDGVLFEYNPQTNVYKKLMSFNASKGIRPCGSLTQANNGKLYGTTIMGGNSSMGVIFEFDITTSVYSVKFNFSYSSGYYPYGSLVQASNGNLFGMTNQGGTSNLGVLFEFNFTNNTYYRRINFNATNGRQPNANSLILASNNNLYGLTTLGGDYNYGVLFEYNTTTATYIKKYDFDGSNGSEPNASLLEVSNGIFYGLTSKGGANDFGVVFEYDLSTLTYTKKIDFDGNNNGKTPRGTLIKASNGKLYGMTYAGGSAERGVLFSYNTTNSTINKILDFSYSPNGCRPQGSLLLANNNKFYGMTSEGGASNLGVLFEYNPINDSLTKKADFSITNGSYPNSTLIQASNNKIYGTTNSGGANDMGVLFEFDPVTNTYSIKAEFDGSNNGSYPSGDLVQISNGKLYGTAEQGGASNNGVIFEFDPTTNTFTKKYDFLGGVYGRFPKCKLIETSNGNLYGVLSNGGSADMGILFEFNPQTQSLTTKVDFDGSNSRYPIGSLVLASNGKLYGTAYSQYSYDIFSLFEYDPSNSNIQVLSSFNGTNYGTLMQAADGKLYGTSYLGGTNNFGYLFSFDLIEQNNSNIFSFLLENGANPYYTQLVETCKFPSISAISTDTLVCNGSGLNLHIIADGNISYKWQVNTGSGFTNINDNSIYQETSKDSLHILSTTSQMNLYQYRCIISSSCPVISMISDTVILKIKEPFHSILNAGICPNTSYSWRGNSYTTANTYTAAFIDINGCDSIYTLNLTVNQPFYSTLNAETCANIPYNWQGNSYTTANTYTASYTDINGCDSIYTLNLTINQPFNSTLNAETCANIPYSWQGNSYTTANTYTASYTD